MKKKKEKKHLKSFPLGNSHESRDGRVRPLAVPVQPTGRTMGRDVVTRLPLQRVQGRPTAPTTASKGENNGRTRVHVAMDIHIIMDIHNIMDTHNDQWMLQSITQIYMY